jgi:tRNA (adenine57-N1/adenine58-N1)-methyltransferase
MAAFGMGETVLLSSQKGKKWLVKIEEGQYSLHLGTINLSDIVGREETEYIETSKGAKLFLLRPTLEDYIFKMPRQTQIVYPKDLGAMVLYADIKPGDRVLETGIGSGALSLALLRALGEHGTLISVEKRPEFARLAKTNIAKFYGGHPANHSILVSTIEECALHLAADRVVLDLPEPWHAIRHVTGLLRNGGLLVSLSPNVGQVQLTYRELKSHGFIGINSFEILKRDWKVDELRARPVDRMVAHTGFITVARKALPRSKPTDPATPSEPRGEAMGLPDTDAYSDPRE